MPNTTLIKKLETLEQDSSIVELENTGPVLLLSEDATREVCLALDTLLDQIDPHDPDKQEVVGYLYDGIMDVFAFERGSYVLLNPRNAYLLETAFEQHTPDDEPTFENVVETVAAYTDDIKTQSQS